MSISDKLVVSSYALWAGDYSFAASLLNAIKLTGESRKRDTQQALSEIDVQAEGNEPADVFEATVEAIRNHLRDVSTPDNRDRKNTGALGNEPQVILEGEQQTNIRVITAKNEMMRGTVWSDGPRDFSLRAFPTSTTGLEAFDKHMAKIRSPRDWHLENDSDGDRKTWIWRPNRAGALRGVFITITLDHWALASAQIKWINRRVPTRFSEIEYQLEVILNALADMLPDRAPTADGKRTKPIT